MRKPIQAPRLAPRRSQKPQIPSGLVDKREPWWPLPMLGHIPPPYDIADMAALKALRDGTASPQQQQRALMWIVHVASGKEALPYVPEDPHGTAFWNGRRCVSLFIMDVLNSRMPGPAREDGER